MPERRGQRHAILRQQRRFTPEGGEEAVKLAGGRMADERLPALLHALIGRYVAGTVLAEQTAAEQERVGRRHRGRRRDGQFGS